MQRVSKHDVNKLTTSEIRDRLPFILVSDGEDIALLSDVNRPVQPIASTHDVNRLSSDPVPSHDVNKPMTELPLSKKRQASGRLSDF